jgi:hypothetical protein
MAGETCAPVGSARGPKRGPPGERSAAPPHRSRVPPVDSGAMARRLHGFPRDAMEPGRPARAVVGLAGASSRFSNLRSAGRTPAALDFLVDRLGRRLDPREGIPVG